MYREVKDHNDKVIGVVPQNHPPVLIVDGVIVTSGGEPILSKEQEESRLERQIAQAQAQLAALTAKQAEKAEEVVEIVPPKEVDHNEKLRVLAAAGKVPLNADGKTDRSKEGVAAAYEAHVNPPAEV